MNSILTGAIGMSLLVSSVAGAGERCAHLQSCLVGTWGLMSIYDEDEGGEDLAIWGDDPRGSFVANVDGSFSFQLIGDVPLKPSHVVESSSQHAAAPYGAVSYVGRYSVDEPNRRLTLRVERSTIPAWNKSERQADLKIDSTHMELTSTVLQTPTGSPYTHSVWVRIR